MNKMKSQHQIFYEEQRKIADLNLHFLKCVESGLTRKELQRLIDCYPMRWARFANWLEKLE